MLSTYHSSSSLGSFRLIKLASLKTFKMSKVKSKQKVCTSSNNFWWSPMTFTSELLWWCLRSGQLSQRCLWHLFCKTTDFFSCVHTSNLLSGFLSRAEHVPLKIKRLETTSWSSSLAEPPKSPKLRLLQNRNCKTNKYIVSNS